MSIGFDNRIGSLGAQRNVDRSQNSLAETLKRLSSGRRVNSAADDAAALAISEGLQAQTRSLQQAQRNANDGISMLQTADSALGQTSDTLARMRELAVQSSNGTLSDDQRAAIQTEFSELRSEIDRSAATTEFNGKQLLNGSAGNTTLQVGADEGDQIIVGQTDARAATLGISTADLSTAGGAMAALSSIDSALKSVSGSRATLGAAQNRLTSTLENLGSRIESQTAATSRIRDADVASETASLAAARIRTQAGVMILGQSNMMNHALTLLGGK